MKRAFIEEFLMHETNKIPPGHFKDTIRPSVADNISHFIGYEAHKDSMFTTSDTSPPKIVE
jgi:hypothetical protein